MNGIIIINKEKNMTSRDVVNKLCYLLGTKKIGHTGTLDPLATGVMVVVVGKYTKLCELLTSEYKEYIASIKLGIETDTLDVTGRVLKEKAYNVSEEQIITVLNSFKGNSIQEVPMYSAIKINGKKLYEYARNNEVVDIPKRDIDVKEIEFINYKDGITTFKCLVSKGTYIRSLIRDISYKLNTVGSMESLERTKQGRFSINESFTLDDVKNNNYELLRIEEVVDMDTIELKEKEYKKVKNGNVIDNSFSNNICMLKYNNEEIAIYKVCEKDNTKAKPLIMLK